MLRRLEGRGRMSAWGNKHVSRLYAKQLQEAPAKISGFERLAALPADGTSDITSLALPSFWTAARVSCEHMFKDDTQLENKRCQ